MLLKEVFMMKKIQNKHLITLSHATRSIALSFTSVYIPIFLLSRGFTLSQVIGFFALYHLSGLIFTLVLFPVFFARLGLVRTIQSYFFIETSYLLLLNYFVGDVSIWWLAILGGIANMVYWIPKNILFLNHAEFETMGSDLGWFMGLPKLAGIVGPIVSALIVTNFGFTPIFIISAIGLMIPGIILSRLTEIERGVTVNLGKGFKRLWNERGIFTLEYFDNIIEESEWFWPIFVFVSLGALELPGIIGAISSIAAFIFAITVGKIINTHQSQVLNVGILSMVVISLIRVAAPASEWLYLTLSFIAAFASTAFLAAYFAGIYRKVKSTGEENTEFMIVREIPTIIARLTVFGVLLLITSGREFYILPIVALFVLLGLMRRVKTS